MNLTQYSPQLIAAVIAFSSVMIGLLWNQIFAWYKHRREKKAKLNYLLFNLLELYYLLSKHDISKFIKMYIAKMESKLGKIPDSERVMVQTVISTQIKSKMALFSKDEIDKLEGNYEAAVKQIAEINPFLAFRLAGQSKRINAGDMLNQYYESCRELIPNEHETKIFDVVKEHFTEERLLTEAIEDLKESVLEVSKKAGFLKTHEAKKFFKSQETLITEDMNEEIDQLINLILAQITV